MESIASPLGGVKIVEVNLTGTLSSEEKEMVKKLQERDVQVRRHEQAHLATAGPHALGGPQYTFQVGPDGRRYAIGGEVQVDMSPVSGDAEATLRKAQQLQQAALAPVDPSGADRNVAMAAAHMAQDARQKIVEERREAAEEIREEKAPEKSKETETGEGAVEPSQATGNPLPPAHTNPAEADSPPLVSQNEQTENESSHNLDFYA
ncbi:MAG: hypothetical protein KF753_05530 [Caldilineaceae bacterium]|nr:hypothetical protein [Caldilineaceae bacterium]